MATRLWKRHWATPKAIYIIFYSNAKKEARNYFVLCRYFCSFLDQLTNNQGNKSDKIIFVKMIFEGNLKKEEKQ